MSVKEYFDELHIAMARARVKESSEATMDRFLHGLNPYIAKQMELYPYSDIKGMVSIAIELEKLMREKERKREKEKREKERDAQKRELEEKRKIEMQKSKEIESKECYQNSKSKNKSEKKEEHDCEKSEVKSDCKDISFITNDHNHSFTCVFGELQVLEDLSPKEPIDGFLSSKSISSLSLSSNLKTCFGGINFVVPNDLLYLRCLDPYTLNVHYYMNFMICRCPYYLHVVGKKLSYYFDFVVVLGFTTCARGIQFIIYIWVHVRKKRPLIQHMFQKVSKIEFPNMTLRSQDPHQILTRTHDINSKLPPLCKYYTNITFEVSYFFPFDAGADSRTNLFEEEGNDRILGGIQIGGHKAQEALILLEAQQALQETLGDYKFLKMLTWTMTWIIAWITWTIAYVELDVVRGRAPPKPPWHVIHWFMHSLMMRSPKGAFRLNSHVFRGPIQIYRHGGVQWSSNISNWGPNALCNGPWEFQNVIQLYSSPNRCLKSPYVLVDVDSNVKIH